MNTIEIVGTVDTKPVLFYEANNKKFYSFFVSAMRTSGAKDVLPCAATEDMIKGFSKGKRVSFVGEIRTKIVPNPGEGGTRRSLLVFVIKSKGRKRVPNRDKNSVCAVGTVCTKPEIRITPNGRIITDLVLACNYNSVKSSSYIPCVSWEKNAFFSNSLEVGNDVYVTGRLQSRVFYKREEKKTVYEISVEKIDTINDWGRNEKCFNEESEDIEDEGRSEENL